MLRDRTGQDSNFKNFDGTGQDNSQTNGTGRDRIDLGGNSDGTGQDRDPVLSCPVPQDRIDPVTSPEKIKIKIGVRMKEGIARKADSLATALAAAGVSVVAETLH